MRDRILPMEDCVDVILCEGVDEFLDRGIICDPDDQYGEELNSLTDLANKAREVYGDIANRIVNLIERVEI